MKKLLSFFIAGVLAVGLIGCSGDLHDNNDAPIVERPTVIVGAMNYDGGNVFSEMVKVDELTSSYTFIYKSSMSSNWGSPADGVAFKVGYEVDDWDHCWSQEEAGTAQLADGTAETVCKAQNAENIAFGGLADGKTYKITVTAGIASVSVKIEQAADIPSYTLNANGMLYAMDYSADGEKGVYKTTLSPTSENLELIFFDGTDNYGSKTTAIDVSGSDTDKDGNATASKTAVVEKLSDTVTSGAQYLGLKKNSDEFFEYIVTLTVDGEAKTVSIIRIIPQHSVTFSFTVTGGNISEGYRIFIHGWNTIGSYGFEWPVTDDKKFDTSKKTWSALVNADGKASITGTIKLLDNKTYPEETCFCAGVFDKTGKFLWQTGDTKIPSYKTGVADETMRFNLVLTAPDPEGDKGSGVVTQAAAPTVNLNNIIVNADLKGYTLIGDFNTWGGDVEGVVADGKTTYDVSTYTSDTLGKFKFRHNKAWDDPQIQSSDGNIALPDSEKAGKADVIIDVDMTTLIVTKIEYSYIE